MRALGATTCTAHPKVLRNIAKQLEEHNIVSTHELQIARRMGIVATSPVGRAGFNDGILFPYELFTAEPASAPVIQEAAVASVESKTLETRNLHVIALLVDVSHNYVMRRPKECE